MKIYTKGGDAGETGLIDGSRVFKDDGRVTAYGEVDELNAVLGLARAHSADAAVRTLLHDIQKDLFALGAQLADPQDPDRFPQAQGGRDDRADRGPGARDRRARRRPCRRCRPSSCPAESRPRPSSISARTVCRRAERATVSLARREKVDPLVVAYLNRLSDLLFVLAREANLRAGEAEERW